ncbi:MAG: peptidoglycan-binding protein, partial [Actinobacteria bacterium]|nr:peptidoglycan-binding protein [Actinomycetota bacterium]
MYRHTISVFSSDGKLRKTVRDSVDLRKLGIADAKPGLTQGAPVETAFSPDGQTAWISNYAMYGAGFGPEGTDDCP